MAHYRRFLFIIVLQVLLIFVLVGRMYQLQIIEGQRYANLAEGNRIAQRLIIPKRGMLYDRRGQVLAQDETDFRVIVLADSRDQRDLAIEQVAQLIHLPFEDKEYLLKKSKNKKILEPFTIKENLTWEEVALLELHVADLPGVTIELGHHRHYPEKENGAHLIGYVGSVSESEAHAFPAIPNLKVGKQGIEKFYESKLLGQPGIQELEVNARRKIVRELGYHAPLSGADITLSIDATLTGYVQKRLSAVESASVVVLDIESGEVLAMVSHPTFDLNLFPQGIREKDWGPLRDNPYVPLTNKALAGLYAPGSTTKMLTVLAALEKGIIAPTTQIHCPGYVEVNGHRFHCWKHHGGHGWVNAERALRESCDVFLYEISRKVGIDYLSAFFKNFGLGQTHAQGIRPEKSGLVPTREWKNKTTGHSWYPGDTVQASIGQGYMLSTPLQLAVMTARLVSGKKVEPQFTKKHLSQFDSLDVKRDHHNLVIQAMNQVTNDPTGTAYRWRIREKGFEMAGKTGTSQVRRISAADRKAGRTKTHHLPWKYREHGLFVGYAPIHNPRYAIAVVAEHSGGGSVATHLGRDILLETQKIMDQSR